MTLCLSDSGSSCKPRSASLGASGLWQYPIREFPRIPHLIFTNSFHLLIVTKGPSYFKLEIQSQAQSYQDKILSLDYTYSYITLYRDSAGTVVSHGGDYAFHLHAPLSLASHHRTQTTHRVAPTRSIPSYTTNSLYRSFNAFRLAPDSIAEGLPDTTDPRR